MNMDNTKIFKMAFAKVYPMYIQKAEKKVGQSRKQLRRFAGLPDTLINNLKK